ETTSWWRTSSRGSRSRRRTVGRRGSTSARCTATSPANGWKRSTWRTARPRPATGKCAVTTSTGGLGVRMAVTTRPSDALDDARDRIGHALVRPVPRRLAHGRDLRPRLDRDRPVRRHHRSCGQGARGPGGPARDDPRLGARVVGARQPAPLGAGARRPGRRGLSTPYAGGRMTSPGDAHEPVTAGAGYGLPAADPAGRGGP